jgi:hypothetical protein
MIFNKEEFYEGSIERLPEALRLIARSTLEEFLISKDLREDAIPEPIAEPTGAAEEEDIIYGIQDIDIKYNNRDDSLPSSSLLLD